MKSTKNAALGFIFATILIDVIGLGIIIPVSPSLIVELTGCSLSKASQYGGYLVFSYSVMQFIFSPIVGALSDKIGRRPVLLLALLGLGIDYVFQAFTPTFALLIIGRVIAGIMGASFTTAMAYISDVSTPENRTKNFGLMGAAFGLGFIIGPSIGSLCSIVGAKMDAHSSINWAVRLPFIVAAGFSVINLLYGYFILPESLDKSNRRPIIDWKKANPIGSLLKLKKYPIVSGLVLSYFLIYLASHSVQSNWAYYTKYKFNWSDSWVGLSLSMFGIFVALVQGGLIRYTIPLFGEKKSVYLGFTLYALGLLLFAFATETWMMFLFIIPYCLGGLGGPALQGIIANQVASNEQGELQGALTSVMSVTSILGPLMMNNLFAYFTSDSAPFKFAGMPFVVGAILVSLALIFSVPSMKKYHNSKIVSDLDTIKDI